MTYLTTAVAVAAAAAESISLLGVREAPVLGASAADTDGGNCKACLTDSKSLSLAGLRGGRGVLSLGGRGGGLCGEEGRTSDGRRGGGGSGPAME